MMYWIVSMDSTFVHYLNIFEVCMQSVQYSLCTFGQAQCSNHGKGDRRISPLLPIVILGTITALLGLYPPLKEDKR